MNRIYLVMGLLFTLTQVWGQTAISSIPNMRVDNIRFDNPTYALNETVKGTFSLQNCSQVSSGQIYCRISLVKLDESGHVAHEMYDQKQLGPVTLNPNSQKKISFEYPITFAPDNSQLAIHIRVVTESGLSLAWSVSPLKVTGGVSILNPMDAALLVNDQKFGLQEGPTIKQTDAAVLELTLKNPGKESIKVTPDVILNDVALHPVPENKPFIGEEIVVPAGEIITAKIGLPSKGIKPLTYLAKVILKDDSGMQRAPFIFVRYIMGGDIAIIHTVSTSNALPVKAGDIVNVSVICTGKPYDIALPNMESITNDKANPVVADLKVDLFDGQEKLLGSALSKDVKLHLLNELPVNIKVNAASDKLFAKAVLSKGDKTLYSFEGPVIIRPTQVKTATSKPNNVLIWVITLVGVLIAGGLIFFFLKRKRSC